MTRRWKAALLALGALLAALTAGGAALSATRAAAGHGGGGGGGTAVTLTVGATQDGVTQASTGANEGAGGFDVADITGLGLTNYRIYGGMSRFEPVDDSTTYGSPTIAQIKANPAVVNWAQWDAEFARPDGYFWANTTPEAQVAFGSMLAALKTAGVQPVIVLRARDNNNQPSWISPCIATAADQAEWWEHVFAMVYETDVRNDYGVDRWEIGNEPNQRGQGWLDNSCTLAQYYAFANLTADAIRYVYATYLPGRTPIVHGPVISGAPNRETWAQGSLQNVDGAIDVFDYHWYSSNQDTVAAGYRSDVQTFDPDGVVEPLWLSEWGTYNSTYDTVSAALGYAQQLYLQNLPASYVSGSDVFSMYTWGSSDGLVDNSGVKSETYWAFKTFLLGTQGGKAEYPVSGNTSSSLSVLASEDSGGFYLTLINSGTTSMSVTANVSAHRTSGTGTLTEYSAASKAAVVASPVVSGGNVSFTIPASAIQTLRIP